MSTCICVGLPAMWIKALGIAIYFNPKLGLHYNLLVHVLSRASIVVVGILMQYPIPTHSEYTSDSTFTSITKSFASTYGAQQHRLNTISCWRLIVGPVVYGILIWHVSTSSLVVLSCSSVKVMDDNQVYS